MTARVFRSVGGVCVLILATLGVAAGQQPEDAGSEKEPLDEASGAAFPVLNIGGHGGTIGSVALTSTARRLYTVGFPGNVIEWGVGSGERMRTWYFPRSAYRLGLSWATRQLAAVTTSDEKNKCAVWLVDLGSGEARPGPMVGQGPCHALAFSPKGDRLAVGRVGAVEIHPVKGKGERILLKEAGEGRSLAFHPSGRWLLSTRYDDDRQRGDVFVYDLAQEKPKRVALAGVSPVDAVAAWSSDGKRLGVVNGGMNPGIYVWDFSDKPKLQWKAEGSRTTGKPAPKPPKSKIPPKTDGSTDLVKLLKGSKERTWRPGVVAFLGNKGVLGGWRQTGKLKLVQFAGKNLTPELLPADIVQHSARFGRVTVSSNGRWLAATGFPAYQVDLYDLQKHTASRIGPSVRPPKTVGWTADGRGVVWGYSRRPAKDWQQVLSDGLHLGKLEHVAKKDLAAARTGGLPPGWSIQIDKNERGVLVRPNKKTPLNVPKVRSLAAQVFTDAAGKQRLLLVHHGRYRIGIIDPDTGEQIAPVGRHITQITDAALSPDGKYVAVASGAAVLNVYALARPGAPLVHIMATERGDWAAWTPKGYYAGTPGGEKLIGWKVVGAADQPATFYPAATFRKKLYRPDLVQKLLEAGSVKAALAMTADKTRDVSVEDVLPPRVDVRVEQDETDRAKATIRVTAESSAADQPVEMLRLLVDGRPLPDKQGVEELAKGQKKVSVKWTIPKLPGGRLELKVLARCPDVSGVSTPKVVVVPTEAKNRPTLHVVSVGLNYAGKPGLTLGCAINDATAISKAFRDACTGADNLFRQDGEPQTLLEEKATTKAVLSALAELHKKKPRPQDLVVFFFAGHGVRQGKEFYLLTHDADLKSLPKTALSGTQLREALRDLPCQVLLLLDACHSGAAVKDLLSATDAASRRLADEECGVTLLAAAMGYEKAEEEGSNGRFTLGLLKALGKAKSLPHNHRDGRQYVHHLYSYVFDEVKALSKDRQHPFLSLPWTSESFAIRQLTSVVEEP